MPDSYAFFILRGLGLLCKGGALGYIIPNTFCDLENGEEFRKHLLKATSLQNIWQSGWVFSAAVVDTRPRNFLSVKVFRMDLEADFKRLFVVGFGC